MRLSFVDDGGGWRAFLPTRSPAPAFHGDQRVHTAVLGAGFTGMAAAREWARLHPDHRVAILDARELGAGASGRNAGFAVGLSQFGGPIDPERADNERRINRLNASGLSLLRAAAAPAAADGWWREAGFHYLAAGDLSATEAGHFHRYLQDFGFPGRWLDRADIAAELGTAHYRCGVQVPVGALVQPVALLRRLVERLPAQVALFERSPVRAIDRAGRGWSLRTDGGRLRAERVLLAGNFELPQLGFLQQRITATTLSGSFTRPLSDDELAKLGSLRDWGVLGLHSGAATVRLTRCRRIMLRNGVNFCGGRLLDADELGEQSRQHRARFEARFPPLAGVPFEASWSGCEGVSRNLTSFFGSVGQGLYLSAGYNGSGLSRGTAMGTALARLAAGHRDALVEDASGFAPARWIPPRPLADLGAAWTLRRRFAGVGEDR